LQRVAKAGEVCDVGGLRESVDAQRFAILVSIMLIVDRRKASTDRGSRATRRGGTAAGQRPPGSVRRAAGLAPPMPVFPPGYGRGKRSDAMAHPSSSPFCRVLRRPQNSGGKIWGWVLMGPLPVRPAVQKIPKKIPGLDPFNGPDLFLHAVQRVHSAGEHQVLPAIE
jgi:hypothetical protein